MLFRSRSFVVSCELAKVDPFAWFRDVLGRIADHPINKLADLFEAIIEDGLECSDGFREAGDILEREGETALMERCVDFQLAINVVKHGRKG